MRQIRICSEYKQENFLWKPWRLSHIHACAFFSMGIVMHNIALKVSDRTPFFYGWVVLFCACCAGFVRQGPAVATLSIFVTPMTDEFEWSRTAISGAVSIGGVLAAIISPFLGPFIDKHGARGVLCSAILITALCTVLLLSLIHIWRCRRRG